MKKSPVAVLSLILLGACGGGNSNPQPTTPNAGDLAITSASKNVYYDDTFTIQGVGFNSDITKDTVSLGWMNYSPAAKDSVFASATAKDGQGKLQQPIILSATETEIKFKLSDPQYFQNTVSSPFHKAAVQVSSGGKKAIFHGLSIKKIFRVDFSLVGGPNTPIVLGQQFYAAVTSPTSLCTMHALINDCNSGCSPGDFNKCECAPGHNIDLHCETVQLDSNGLFLMTIPPGIIPNSDKPCTNATLYQARLKFTNGDGKVFDTYAWLWACAHG